jgi:membrane protein
VVGFLKRVFKEVQEDAVFTWAAALAYSWLFALFPFMIALLTLAPYLPGETKQNVLDETRTAVAQNAGGQAAEAIVQNVQDVMTNTQGGLLSLGLVLAIWSASGGMAMTMTALDKTYEVTCDRSFVKQRLLAIALTLATMVLILLVAVLLPIGGAITKYFENRGVLGPFAAWTILIARYLIALGLLFAVVSLMYYFGPNIKQKYQAITPGAAFAVVIWIVMGIGFSIYVTQFGNFNKTYGTLGAVIVLLLFFYLSATVLLIGAEVNSVVDFTVLQVQPGTRDFTGEIEAAKASQQMPSSTATINSPGVTPGVPKPNAGAPALAGLPGRTVEAPAGWWKWAAAAVATGWLADRADRRTAR